MSSSGHTRADEMWQRVAVGAAVIGSAAVLTTAAVLERRALAKMIGEAVARTAQLGRTLAVATGLRPRPAAERLLPGVGALAGVIVGGSAALLLTSRVRADREPRTERPSGENAPWDLIDPRGGEPNGERSQQGLQDEHS
jgi:hypothetical protein